MELSNEQKLILYCSQARPSKTDLERINALAGLRIDWEYVSDTALSNGIAQLLYYHLKNIRPCQEIGSTAIEQFKKVYLSNTAKNMLLGHELCRLLNEFSAKHIDVIVLKGATLANRVYPDPGLRIYSDIDVLVKEGDLPIVEELVLGLRYARTGDSIKQDFHKEKHHHLTPFIHLDYKIALEIHFNVTHRFDINIDSWWDRSKLEKIMGCAVRVLSPNDFFLHLCIHTAKHGIRNIDLRDFCDISECIKYYGEAIDWSLFQEEIERYPICREVFSFLYYAKRMFCTDVSCLDWLTSQKSDSASVSLLEELIFSDDRDSIYTEAISRIFVQDDFRGKFRVVMNDFFPDRKFMAMRYSLPLSSKRIYFYYLIRPIMKLLKNRKNIGQILSSFFRFS